MLQSSGLTPEQVRTRLKAAGYSDQLLDQYLPGAKVRADSTMVPDDEVFSAVRRLGISDTLALDSLTATARNQRRTKARLDSAFMDTVQKVLKDTTMLAAFRSLIRSKDLQREQLDSGFTVYGLELFEAPSSQFDANLIAAVDPSYRFGPGDVLNLVMTGDFDRNLRLTVNRQGNVTIPDVGVVSVIGQTPSQLDANLSRRLSQVYSGIRRGTLKFFVDLGSMGNSQVFVQGDVAHPNSYVVSRAGTIMTALYKAGGPTANGSMRDVRVTRNGELVATLDVYDLALRGDASHDSRLESGDIIFVPPRGPQVRVAGAVLRPATYEAKNDETVGQVLRLAGGMTEAADRRRIQIERIVPPKERTSPGGDRTMMNVPPELVESVPVRGGDVIRVFPVAKRVANRAVVSGNVWSPGAIGLTPGMTLFTALRLVGGLKPTAYLGSVLISRLRSDSTPEMLHTPVLDTIGHPVTDFTLVDGDSIVVFSTTDMRPQRFVTVAGAVRNSGDSIPYHAGMTLRDAVLMAGGLREGALMTNVEIARLPSSRGAGITATMSTVSLDSTFLFDRGADGRVIIPPGVVVPAGRVPEVLLEPYDAIQIKWQPEWQLQQMVALSGEVLHPGNYALLRSTERLSDLLKQAGGLTTAAYAGGIVFVRKRDNIGRIGLDLPAVLRDPSHVDNLQLVDGDSISIPKFSQVVTVRGDVHAEVGVAYVDGANIDYYIRSAGGPTVKGDRGRAYVTQPNGKVETKHRRWPFGTSMPRPHPGSTVFVPDKDPNDKRDWLQIATAATSLLGSLVAVAAIVKR